MMPTNVQGNRRRCTNGDAQEMPEIASYNYQPEYMMPTNAKRAEMIYPLRYFIPHMPQFGPIPLLSCVRTLPSNGNAQQYCPPPPYLMQPPSRYMTNIDVETSILPPANAVSKPRFSDSAHSEDTNACTALIEQPAIMKPIIQISTMKPEEETTLISISLHMNEDYEKKENILKRTKRDS
jgi:hypothetical protein